MSKRAIETEEVTPRETPRVAIYVSGWSDDRLFLQGVAEMGEVDERVRRLVGTGAEIRLIPNPGPAPSRAIAAHGKPGVTWVGGAPA